MAGKDSVVSMVDTEQMASVVRNRMEKVLIIDSRSFLEFNDFHVVGAVNVCCSKLVKRRLQHDKVSVRDFLLHSCHIEVDESSDVIVYDQSSVSTSSVAVDSFLHVLLQKLVHVFRRVFLLSGGFLAFQASYRDLCEDKSRRHCPSLTSLSQPCLPIVNVGPTRILPFLYLGSQQDAHNKQLLLDHHIYYEVNVSTNCPKPDFIQDSHFFRLPVNDSYGEKLLPYFVKAAQFIDRVRESNGYVLVHCLAGISRSPTVAIAYVMRHLKMTFDDAFRYVKSKRTTISPNFNFLGQLLEYERQLRAEEVLDSSVGDISSTSPVARCAMASSGGNSSGGNSSGGNSSGGNSSSSSGSSSSSSISNPSMMGKERLSRSISLSLSLKSPLETVPSSTEQSPSDDVVVVGGGGGGGGTEATNLAPVRSITADLSPTTALARLTFDAMETDQQKTGESSKEEHSFFVVSRCKHTKESYHQSVRMREQSDNHFYSNKQTTESRSHMVLTVSKRVSQSVPSLPRTCWKPAAATTAAATTAATTASTTPESASDAAPSSHCSQISVHIERSTGESTHPDVEVRRGGRSLVQRPHSDGARNRRRSSYAPSETSSSISDDVLFPATPSSPLPTHSLLSPQQSWPYARSDSVTTSGLGSEISDFDMRNTDDILSLCGSVRYGCTSEETESLPPDDGVFTELAIPPAAFRLTSPSTFPGRPRPRPSSLLGITPASQDLDWKPSVNEDCDSSPVIQRRPRPTSLNPSSSSLGLATQTLVDPVADDSPQTTFPSGEEVPDSATVFRLWRQREAALEQERPEGHVPLVIRRRSKELSARYSEKRKSSEIPSESESTVSVEKRRSRGPFIRITMAR